MDVRQTRTFECLSEACGCDTEGHAIEGGSRELHLGDDADGYTIRDLFENLVVNTSNGEPVGRSFVNEFFDPAHPKNLFEAGIFEAGGAIGAVNYSAFAGVTGQLLVTQVLEPYQKEEYMVRRLIPTYNSPLEQERWIGIADPADPTDDMLLVQEGEPYKMFGFGEQYVQTPMTRKRGGIIGLTKEAIFYDRTGVITEKAREVGDLLAYNEEKECIGALIGSLTDLTYYYEKRQLDSAQLTLDGYQRASAPSGSYQLSFTYPNRLYPWVNDIPSNPLQDYTSIRLADQYFSNTVDPNRGRPIVVGKPFVIAPHTRRIDILQILQAENIWKLTQQGVHNAGAIATTTGNDNVLGRIGMTADQFLTSRLLKAELQAQLSLTSSQADLCWFYGDVTEAFRYVVNWPVTVTQAPVNSEAEFNQDIVLRWKASKKGRVAWKEPRVIQRHNYLTQTSGA
jgi:hypothetical protein